MGAAGADALFALIKQKQDLQSYRERHWTGTLEDYIEIVHGEPEGGAQRLPAPLRHDPVARVHASTRATTSATSTTGCSTTPSTTGRDAVFGLDAPLMRLVHNVKSAAFGYGTEKRILLLHGPVGSSKSTIARLLKKGLELYSNKPEGALYTYGWKADPLGRARTRSSGARCTRTRCTWCRWRARRRSTRS